MLILQKMPISAELALPTFELLLPTFWGSNPRICWNFSRVPGSVERTCVTSVSQGSWRKYMPTHSDNNLCLSRRYRKIWGKFRLGNALPAPEGRPGTPQEPSWGNPGSAIPQARRRGASPWRPEETPMLDEPRQLLRAMFEAAVGAASPERRIPAHLPPPPTGRTLVVGAGKASAAM